MASSARSRPSGISNRTRVGPALPIYQPAEHPLNENAIRAIQDLHRNHRLDSLKTRLNTANNHLAGAAVDVNDRLVARIALHEKSRARREKQGSQEDNEEEERSMDEKRRQTDELTGRLESGVRQIIDAKVEVQNVEKALKELETNVANNRGAIAPTQSTLGASQFRSNRRRRAHDVSDEDSEFEEDTQTAGENEGAWSFIKRKVGEDRKKYQNETMSHRYAQNNDYVGFKKLVYDAQFPDDDAPPMPHASTWFSDQSPDTADSQRGGAAAAATGSRPVAGDDELTVASEKISIKCPITLLPMKEPVTSTKCPHSFERAAILNMINASDMRVEGSGRRGGGQKAMQCPICTVILTADDVIANPVLVRKIQRVQAAENAQIQDDSDDDDVRAPASHRHRTDEISSSPARTGTPYVKNERRSQAPRNMSREVSMVPNTQIQGLVEEEQGRPSSSAVTDIVDLETEDEDADE